MKASRIIPTSSIEAVKRCHSSPEQQAALYRHSSYLQASPAGTDQKHFQMFNRILLETFSNGLLQLGRYAAAPASGCVFIVRQDLHQMFNFTFLKTSSNFKLHLLARSIHTAFAACLFLNHSHGKQMTICIFPKRKIFDLYFFRNILHFTLWKNRSKLLIENFRCFEKSKINFTLR